VGARRKSTEPDSSLYYSDPFLGSARDQHLRNDRACDYAQDVVEAVLIRLYSVINGFSLKITDADIDTDM
jgi:hypothetical protein